MTTAAKLAAVPPPTADEWRAMADSHLPALRCAYVLANGTALATERLPAWDMGNVVTELGHAANFHRVLAELCETAERRLLDASLKGRRRPRW